MPVYIYSDSGCNVPNITAVEVVLVVRRTLPLEVDVGVALVLLQVANLVTRQTVVTHWPMKMKMLRRSLGMVVGIIWNMLLIPTLVLSVYCMYSTLNFSRENEK